MSTDDFKNFRRALDYVLEPKERLTLLSREAEKQNNRLQLLSVRERVIIEHYTLAYSRWHGKEPDSRIPCIDSISQVRCYLLKTGAALALLLELALAALITPTALDINPAVAAMIGGLVAISFAILVKALMVGLLLDEKYPRRSSKQFKWVGLVSVSLSLLMLIPFIFGRTYGAAGMIADLAIGFEGTCLPICAGSLWAAATVLGWSSIYSKEYSSIKESELSIKAIRTEIQSELEVLRCSK